MRFAVSAQTCVWRMVRPDLRRHGSPFKPGYSIRSRGATLDILVDVQQPDIRVPMSESWTLAAEKVISPIY